MLVAGAPAASAQAPAAPILLVVNDSAPYQFGRYLGEILTAEGISSFETAAVGALTAADLAGRDLVILAETPLTAGQAALINNYYAAGGRLLAMRPDAQIAGLFGLGAAGGTLDSAYLRVINGAVVNGEAPGLGITDQTIQYHGLATQHNTLPGAVMVAQLYSDAATAAAFPAVVSTSDGRASAFTYDLARSVVLTRQGDPTNIDSDNDGDGLIRARDLFLRPGGNHWIDRNKIPIPQADEQQRLFARLVRQAVEGARPLPRLWYFPGTARTMLILTSDSHANPVSAHEDLIEAVEAYSGAITIYLAIGAPNDATIQGWQARGHTFGLHPYAFQPNSYPPYNIETLAQGFSVYDTWFRAMFTNPPSRTVRIHDLAWQGWTAAAEIARSYNLKLDTNFFTSGSWLQRPDGSWPHGYLTGSGQPMRMARDNGVILDYFQQLTQLIDVQMVCLSNFEGLTSGEAVLVSSELIDRSQAGDYAALMAIFHVDCVNEGETPGWISGTLNYARSQGVPIWNADRWLNFVETRYAARYSGIAWNDVASTLTFSMTAPAGSESLSTVIPLNYNGRSLLSVSVDGSPAAFSAQTIKGRAEAFVTVPAGNHSFTAVYEVWTPPIVAPGDAARTTDPRPAFRWLRVSRADYYEIQISRANPPQTVVYTVPQTAAPQVVFTPPAPLLPAAYTWQARSRTNAGDSSAWSVARTLFVDSAASAAPARNYFTTAAPRLSWGRVSGAAGYEVQVAANSAFSAPLAFSAALGASEFAVTSAPLANGVYFWRVRARRADGSWGPWSAADSFVVDAG
ncbi:MAG: hypothetical protein BroJett033_3260 [Chloroflexota bacterium]|nr:MAG: hypothetical protein BroJett033_3260 [Chloroflexota bacterium]